MSMRRLSALGGALLATLALGVSATTGQVITWDDQEIAGADRYDNGTAPDSWPDDTTPAPAVGGLHGQVNISGATLFVDFFGLPASTNDYGIYQCDLPACTVDGDCPFWCDPLIGCCYRDVDESGFGLKHDPFNPPGVFPQPLATGWTGGNINTVWLVNYRGVGSGNGIDEFLDAQAIQPEPPALPFPTGRLSPPPDGFINGESYSESPSPVFQYDISLAVSDVPIGWFTSQTGDGAPCKKPGQTGYGQNLNNPPNATDWSYQFEPLTRPGAPFNVNEAAPDEWTVFSHPIAWVPIAFITNRGVNKPCFTVSELQCLYTTGRLPNGENLVAGTRTPFSGTRNGAMNSIGLDPSWGMGDNLGRELGSSSSFEIGYEDDPDAVNERTQPTNAEGSSGMEQVVRNWRLGVGYNGIFGGSRAAGEGCKGRYEIVSVKFDDRGGVACVHPSVDAVVHNANANSGWQVGGPETFMSNGDPAERDPAGVTYMNNQAAAEYLLNIKASIQDWSEFVGTTQEEDQNGTPGQALARRWTLLAAVDALPNLANPTNYIQQFPPDLNINLQNDTLANLDTGCADDPGLVPEFGTQTPAGKVPKRHEAKAGESYTDGSTTGEYCDGGGQKILGDTLQLSERNAVQGDFDNNDVRDINDAEELVNAWRDPRGFQAAEGCQGGDPQDQFCDIVIPEVLGDFNGDGDLSKEDLRYFADGLALDNGQLDRKAGATAIDNAIIAQLGAQFLPWADTADRILTAPAADSCGNPVVNLPAVDVDDAVTPFLATGAAYKAGDFRADVAGTHPGGTVFGGLPLPGAHPNGWDGTVNHEDINYIAANIGQIPTEGCPTCTFGIDLSCDMNGDLKVNFCDVVEVVEVVLATTFGDVNLDGVADGADEAIISGNIGLTPAGWEDGDVNLDGVVDGLDLAIAQGGIIPIAGWRSVKDHDPTAGVNEMSIELDTTATGTDATNETRLGGIEKVVVDFCKDVTPLVNTGNGVVADDLTNAAQIPASSVTLVGGTSLEIVFSPALPNNDPACYSIDLSTILDPTLVAQVGSDTCTIRGLAGNTSGGDQVVNLIDAAEVKSRNGTPASEPFLVRYDLNKDGVINLIDYAEVKQRNGLATTCP